MGICPRRREHPRPRSLSGPLVLCVWVAALASSVHCSASSELSLTLRFSPADTARRVTVTDVYVLDGCGTDEAQGRVPDAARVRGTQSVRYGVPLTSMLAPIGSARFGVYARARDASCVVVAAGCTDVDAPAQIRAGGSIVVTLTAQSVAACETGALCVGGECSPAGPDAGPDATTDAAIDAPVDVTRDTVLRDTSPDVPRDACPGGFEVCGGACVDLTSSAAHCGSCGRACPMGSTCISSVCMPCVAPSAICGGTCVRLDANNDHCGSCGNACGPMRNCCLSSCVSLMGDEANCGACGVRCAVGNRCCDGRCVNTDVNSNHCGACGNMCAPMRSCMMGVCG